MTMKKMKNNDNMATHDQPVSGGRCLRCADKGVFFFLCNADKTNTLHLIRTQPIFKLKIVL